MTEKHLSSQFDSELNGVSSRVMELGGMVESQINQPCTRCCNSIPKRPTA